MRYGIVILLFLALGCGESNQDSTPTIEKEKFTEVILEMQLLEAHMNEVRVNQIYIRDSANHFYSEIFDRYDISLEDYESTLDYYAEHPREMQDIFRTVNEKLETMEGELAHVTLDKPAISAVGKAVMMEIIAQTPTALYILDDTISDPFKYKDSLFLHLFNHDSILNQHHVNLESFQHSYNNLVSTPQLYTIFKGALKNHLDKEAGKD